MDIRARVLQLCNNYDVTPTRLAELACLTQSTINNITSGRNKSVTVSTIEQICDGLGITLVEFFEPSRRPDLPIEVAADLLEYEKYLRKKHGLL
jgi:transcriptional regulator with XRE-family HTH domain